MKKLVFISTMLALTLNFASAQDTTPYGYYIDAARFSNTTPGGTARIQGLGGTQTALGADMSAIFSNPAGLGLYNRSVFSITPSYTFSNVKSDYLGQTRDIENDKFAIDNTGVVFSGHKNHVGGWQGGAFGFGINKVNDFNHSIRYKGVNTQNSIVDYFIESANGAPTSQFPALDQTTDLTTLAYYNYLIGPWDIIDPSYPDDEYFSDVTSFVRPSLLQEEVIETSGGQYQVNASYGGNYGDFIYFGFGLGITTVNYNERRLYTESAYDYSPEDPTYDPISEMRIEENLTIKGTGFNGTFGLIVRPVSFFRFGASVTTPTMYNLNDTYQASMGTSWNDFFYEDLINGDTTLNNIYAESAIVMSKYKLRTPLKLSGGAAIFLGDVGFISLDAEYLDFSQMHLSSADFSMDGDNDFIESHFSNVLNLRAGAEMRIDVLRLRAGYALNNVPTNATIDFKQANHRISAGFGLRLDKFFFDLAVVNSRVKRQFTPYTLADNSEPNVEATLNKFSGILTLGVNF